MGLAPSQAVSDVLLNICLWTQKKSPISRSWLLLPGMQNSFATLMRNTPQTCYPVEGLSQLQTPCNRVWQHSNAKAGKQPWLSNRPRAEGCFQHAVQGAACGLCTEQAGGLLQPLLMPLLWTT